LKADFLKERGAQHKAATCTSRILLSNRDEAIRLTGDDSIDVHRDRLVQPVLLDLVIDNVHVLDIVIELLLSNHYLQHFRISAVAESERKRAAFSG